MSKYICTVCNYEYDPALGDPDNGIEPGTPFEELPEDWVCPLCGLGKDVFEEFGEVEEVGEFEEVEEFGEVEEFEEVEEVEEVEENLSPKL